MTTLSIRDGERITLKDSLLLTVDFKATPRLVLSLNAIYNHTESEWWDRNFA